MGEWQKPKRDWSLEPKGPTFGHVPPTWDQVRRIEAARVKEPPNPFELMNGGLRDGDHLLIDWMDDSQLRLNGCRLAGYRGRNLLMWTTSGWGRDAGGRCLYMPFLTSLSAVDDFVQMLATTSGYITAVKEESKTRRRFTLETVAGDSRRLVAGDCLSFDWLDRTVEVKRSQGTVDMNLYRTSGRDAVVMRCGIKYISLYHHPSVIARILTEANALQARNLGDNSFLAVHP